VTGAGVGVCGGCADGISARETAALECVRDTLPTCACTSKHARTRTHALHPTKRMDGWPGCIGAHAYAHILSLPENQSLRPPPLLSSPPLPLLGAAPGPSPAGASAGHRQASPPPHTIPAPINAPTHARSPLIRPPAVSPATLPHACLPAAPPVSPQHVAPPRLGPRHPNALRPPRPSLTAVTPAPVHVELAPCRREAVTEPGRRRGAAEGGGEVCPGPGGRFVHVEVVEAACAGRAGGATAARRSHAGRAARLLTPAWLAAAACAAAEYLAPSRRLK
jgi:hypothetical protein